MYIYVAIKASVHASDSAVFGLNAEEIIALSKKFNGGPPKVIVNGILLKVDPITLINALGELGYKIVSSTGEAEIVWTLQREI